MDKRTADLSIHTPQLMIFIMEFTHLKGKSKCKEQ